MTSVTDFADALDSRIVTFIAADTLAQIDRRDPRVTYIPVSGSPLGRLYSWTGRHETAAAAELLRTADLVVCHMLYRYHAQWAAGVARRAGVPYWIVPHGTLDPYVFTYRRWQKRAWMQMQGRWLLQEAAGVIFASDGERQKASPYVSNERCHVVHWPVPVVLDTASAEAREHIRSRHGIPEGDTVILYMGRLHEMKRPLETIDLVAKLRNPSLHLLIVGPEDAITQRQCEQYAARVGARNVHTIGPVYGDAKYEYFFAADAYISLSHRENFGFTVAEALACACPVILGPGIDLTPELRSVGCGWMLANAEPDTAMRAVEDFSAQSRDSLRAMGTRGRDWARQHLTFTSFAERIRALAYDAANIAGRSGR